MQETGTEEHHSTNRNIGCEHGLPTKCCGKVSEYCIAVSQIEIEEGIVPKLT